MLDAAVRERDVSIIIPAHNESSRLNETVTQLWNHFGHRATLLVVANGCHDDTACVVRNLARRFPTVELLEIPHQIGKGGAVRAGLTLGREPYVAFVDADGSTAADQLDVLLTACVERRLSGAIGSRWMAGSTIKRYQPLRRRLASRTFNAFTRVAFGLKFTDTQCGAKVFERSAVNGILNDLEIANFAFDVDVLLLLKRAGKAVEEIPIVWEDVVEYSKVRLLRSGPPMLWALLRLYIRDSVFRRFPFLDILGLSETIPVRFGLDVLFLFGSRHIGSDATNVLVSELQARGHLARVTSLASLRKLCTFALWYVRHGHRLCDVIVHDFGPFGSLILRASAKRKVTFRELEELAGKVTDFCDAFVSDASVGTNSTLYFRRSDEGWKLASQRLEPSTMER